MAEDYIEFIDVGPHLQKCPECGCENLRKLETRRLYDRIECLNEECGRVWIFSKPKEDEIGCKFGRKFLDEWLGGESGEG